MPADKPPMSAGSDLFAGVATISQNKNQRRVLLSAGAPAAAGGYRAIGAMGNLVAGIANDVADRTQSAFCPPLGARLCVNRNKVAGIANDVLNKI